MRSGRSPGSEEKRRAIASALDLTYEQFLDVGRKKLGLQLVEEADEDSSAFDYVRKVGAVFGLGGSFVTNGETVGLYAFRKEFFRSVGPAKDLVIFRADGDSMTPTICGGDMILLNTKELTPKEGELFGVRVGKLLMAKRVFFEPGVMVLRSDNERAGEFRVSIDEESQEDFQIIGKVRWLARVF